MNKITSLWKGFIPALAVILPISSGCEKKKPQPVAVAPTSATAGQVFARIDGQPVTEEEVRKVSGSKLVRAEMDLYDARKEGVDEIVEDKLLEAEAASLKITKADLLKKNVSDKIKVEDKDIEKFYKEKQAQMQGKKLEEVKDNIRNLLSRSQYQTHYTDLVRKLKKKSNVEILISAPKLEVEEGDSPSIGPKDAPIKIVEFTDYQCPFCGRARGTVNQILDTYKGKVRYTIRDFPLSFHKDAVKAHEASHCAGDQEKYWEFNHALFLDQKEIQVDDLKKHARDLKLDMGKFDACLDSGRYNEKVMADQKYGSSLGVSGTPAFFVNGRMISGARPFESFQEIIEDELQNTDN